MSPRRRDINKRPGGSDISEYPGRSALRILSLALLAAAAFPAAAYTVTITAAAPKTVYLQVGVGTFTGLYENGGTPGTNATVNKVSVSVAANAVGNGTAQAMSTDSTQSTSFYDGFAFCDVPQQLYIGGFYRTTGNGNGSVNVTATVPAALVDGSGDQIPFSLISWTTGATGPRARSRASPSPPAPSPQAGCRLSARSRRTSGPRAAGPSPTATRQSFPQAPIPGACCIR